MNLSYYKRACALVLEAAGCSVNETRRSVSVAESHDGQIAMLPAAERIRLWRADALLTGLRAIEAGDSILALRCAIQAARYAGQCDDAGGPAVNDAALQLRSALEDTLRAAGAQS